MGNGKISLYIHIPFCAGRCAYCNFYSTLEKGKKQAYISAVKQELKKWRERLGNTTLETIYFGGGTPTSLPAEELAGILAYIAKLFIIDKDAEITFEANPEGLAGYDLALLRLAGFNRISMGVQSASESELRAIGRRHSNEEVVAAVEAARVAGFLNLSLDLMLGLPLQTEESLKESMDFLISLAPLHISAYILSLEEGTPLFARKNELSIPDEDGAADLYEFALSYLEGAGYGAYEISNFARGEAARARHNLVYWESGEYLGIGPSAHSFLRGERFFYEDDIDGFISSAAKKEIKTSPPEKAGGLWEYLILRLRLADGIIFDEALLTHPSFAHIRERIVENAAPLVKTGHIISDTEHIALSSKGFLLSNYLTTVLLDGV